MANNGDSDGEQCWFVATVNGITLGVLKHGGPPENPQTRWALTWKHHRRIIDGEFSRKPCLKFQRVMRISPFLEWGYHADMYWGYVIMIYHDDCNHHMGILGICNHHADTYIYIYYITSLGEMGIIVGISLMGIAMMDKTHFMGWWSDMSTILQGFHQMNGESVLDFPDVFHGIIYN